jgi:hypothetical protein
MSNKSELVRQLDHALNWAKANEVTQAAAIRRITEIIAAHDRQRDAEHKGRILAAFIYAQSRPEDDEREHEMLAALDKIYPDPSPEPTGQVSGTGEVV